MLFCQFIFIQNAEVGRVLQNSGNLQHDRHKNFSKPSKLLYFGLLSKVGTVLWNTLYVYFWPFLVIDIVHSINKVSSRICRPLLCGVTECRIVTIPPPVKMGKLTSFIRFLEHKMKVECLFQVIPYVKLKFKDISLNRLFIKLNGFRAKDVFM